MTTKIENNGKIYQQLTHGQIAFMSELFEHFKAQKECDVYYLHDRDYFEDEEEKVMLPSIENSEVRSVFDDTRSLIIDGFDPLSLENFCNGFINFRGAYDISGRIDYSLLPYIDFIYKERIGRYDKEWDNLVSYGKKVVENFFDWNTPFEDHMSCTMTVLGAEKDVTLTDADYKKHDNMIAEYIAQEKNDLYSPLYPITC